MFKINNTAMLRQFLLIMTANLNMLCVGLGVSWSSPMLVKLMDGNGTGLPRPITEEEGSWINSIGIICGLPLYFVIGVLMDKLGRKTCLALGCLPRIITCIILLLAKDVWVVILGKAFEGCSSAMSISVVAIYSSEIASKEIRGALGTIQQVASATGMLIFFGVGPFLPYFYVNVLYLCISLAICIPIWCLPESPYYLYCKGRKKDSIKVLTYIHASESIANEEIKQYEVFLNESAQTPSKREIFKDPINLKTFAKVIFMSILFEMIGYNAVVFYMMTIFQWSQTTVKDEIASVIIGCVQLVACFFTILLTDKFGRKPILVITLFAMAVGMIGLGTFGYLKIQEFEIQGVMNYVPLASMMLVIFGYNAGLGSLYWMLTAELFDGAARAVGVSISVFTASLFVFITIKYFVSVMNAIGPSFTFWGFSIMCIIFGLFILFCIPETKGKTFSEIQKDLGRDVKSR